MSRCALQFVVGCLDDTQYHLAVAGGVVAFSIVDWRFLIER